MKKSLRAIWLMLLVFLLTAAPLPAAAAPFDPTVLKVAVDDSLWQSYHLGPEPLSGDVVKLYRIKKAEVAFYSGNREFFVHTFSPRDAKPQQFSVPHGVPNMKVRLKTWAADDVVWTTVIDYKEVGDRLTIRAVPGSLTVCSPGF